MAKKSQEDTNFHELLRHGTVLLQQGKTESAANFLEEALQLEPNSYDAGLNLAGAYILRGQFKKAISLLEILVKNDHKTEAVWTNLGAAYLGNPVLAKPQDQERAISAFKSALDLKPDTPNVAYNIGLIYRDQREYSLAAKWFREAIRTNPNDGDAKSLLKKIEAILESEEE